MNKTLSKSIPLVFSLAAASFLSSCVTDGGYTGRTGHTEHSEEYATYTTLPPNYPKPVYHYDNRYYSGGRYETGRYSSGGRVYTNRYFHQGQYIYGGEYREPSFASPSPTTYRTGPGQQPTYMIYDTLPANYSQPVYYSNNRYYSGGRYETGNYTHGGRNYRDRYFHDGQYFYGGNYRQPGAGVGVSVQQPSSPSYRIRPGY
jgi:hypothetical protein